MTTIAIDENTISADGRATTAQGYIADDDLKKVFELDGVIYGFCGELADAETLVDIISSGAEIPDMTLEATVVTVSNNEIYLHTISKGKYRSTPVSIPFSMGSGDHFALSAMDFGKTSKEAVKYASTRDSSTGGKIKTLTWRK